MTMTVSAQTLTQEYFLIAARISGLVFSAPVLSSSYLPRMLKVVIIIMLAAVLAPTLKIAAMPSLLWTLGLVIQFAIGVLMGLILSLFLSVFDMAGQVVTYELGLGLAITSNPALDNSGSFLSEWQTLLALFVFVGSGGLELSVIALHASFQAIGLNVVSFPTSALSFVIGLMSSALTMTLLVAFPLMLAGLVVNMAVGILSRAFPQMNAYFLSLPVNFGVSLLVFAAMIPILVGILPEFWNHAFVDVSRLLAILEGKS
ncbi:flagellar biosynthetic protein FliR [Sulfobacillus thermosulfidooxidans DSM 9293]|uniref:Flagellar biosynthetic protein FliR n=1 Tax=Sulfobacillus thermosulfidooxidans (strain DSM 9293 / VKM B-1269 / AT-1) TaxID=929705 RepID=A0A1W1WEK4_SULTA|nr:flagellar biosynthetic protein FliR [Sulfobacillus thermosulfidooxidans]SMC04599.1 flagellar biosynthetic protein FliR [Sulfobacillus thermosulfidooxidans DSM 9293]